jgi:hypothetical protein
MSFYEIGGLILDGTYGYDHRRFKKVHNAIKRDKPQVAAAGIADIVVRNLSETKDIPYSQVQLDLRRQIRKRRSQVRRVISAAPVSAPVAVGAMLLLTTAEMWTYAVGSYDMYTPEIQRYEDSLTHSGMTSRVI